MVHCYLTGDGNMYFRKGTLAPPGEYDWTCASFSPLKSTTDTANGSVQSFLHSLWQKVPILYFTMGAPIHQNCPFPWGIIRSSHVTRCFRPKRVHNPNGTSIGSAVFAQMTAECLYSWRAYVQQCSVPEQSTILGMMIALDLFFNSILGHKPIFAFFRICQMLKLCTLSWRYYAPKIATQSALLLDIFINGS